MFANLKNKLIEEVKASPSKFQQLAAAVSSSASTTPSGSDSTTTTTTNENFFSITEEDTPQNSPYKPLKLPPDTSGRLGTTHSHHNGPSGSSGAVPRTRKLSNSSIASDLSFRLPAYDSSPMYHLQSDLESNCSELEDTASTAKLDVITKDQLFDAYKKSLERYHKYRCRYTDLAKKYKELERDSTKSRSVLVETQEKALRRIGELREQCALEQQAKAHLEEALRLEMDDMQCKMQAYQTKLKLLGENPDIIIASNDASGCTSLIDLDDNNTSNNITNQQGLNGNSSTNNLDSMNIEKDASQLVQLRLELQMRQSQIEELTAKMASSEETIAQLRKQEEENALLLAQTKKAIHSELESKESEVRKLTDTIKIMQTDLQETTKEASRLSRQTDELQELREKLKYLQVAKQEADAKLIATEHMLAQQKEQQATKDSALKASGEEIATTLRINEQKLEELRLQNAQLNEMVARSQQHEVSLAQIDNELNRTKNENDNLKATISENNRKLEELQSKLTAQKEQLEQVEQDRKAEVERWKAMLAKEEEDSSKALQTSEAEREMQVKEMKQLESELRILQEQRAQNESDTIAALKAESKKVNEILGEQLSVLKEQLAGKEKELKSNVNKLAKYKKQYENQQNRIREQSGEIEELRAELNKHEVHLASLQSEACAREEQAQVEKAELKTQVQSILHEIAQMEEQMRLVQSSHGELEAEKLRLEQKIERMQREAQDASEGTSSWDEQLAAAEDRLRQLESKLQNVESENSQLAEKNCLLEERNNRFEKQLVERERQQDAEEVNANEMRLKLETAETAIQKLNDKIAQVLDENSRMHNARELMDHDYRTLQDKCDALEKEKLLVEDAQSCLQAELEQLRERKVVSEARFRETVEQLQQAEEKCAEEKKKNEAIEAELNEMRIAQERLEGEKQTLSAELNELKAVQLDGDKLQTLIQEQQGRIEALERELVEKERAENENTKLKDKLIELKTNIAELEQYEANTKEEREILRAKIDELNRELGEERNQSREISKELEVQVQRLELMAHEKETSEETLKTLKVEVDKLTRELDLNRKDAENKAEELERMQQELQSANAANKKLADTESELQKERELQQSLRTETTANIESYIKQIRALEEQLRTASGDVERLHESNDAIQVEMDKLQNRNELHVQQLEATLKQLRVTNERLQQQVEAGLIDAEKVSNYEQLQVENEYLGKHVKQLEVELASQRVEATAQLQVGGDLREKLKSLQCELYVLRERDEKYNAQLAEKQKAIENANSECNEMRQTLASDRIELARQTEHARYIAEQNDAIQSDLLHKENKLAEIEHQLRDTLAELNEVKLTSAVDAEAKEKELEALRIEVQRVTNELETKMPLQDNLNELRVELAERSRLENVSLVPPVLSDIGQKSTSTTGDAEYLRHINEALQRELEDLKHRSTAQISELQQEIEDMQNNAKHMAERLVEVERVRAALRAQQLPAGPNAYITDEAGASSTAAQLSECDDVLGGENKDLLQREKAELAAKLHAIMNEVRDVSERNIFLEQQCENYLILEQSNERLKLQNAKLSRQLDETLVSMQHNEGITANTEFEYLRNIMFQYLTGSANGNNETLVKVISAVLKFSPQQTQVALEKEHQRRSLLNKIL